MLQLLKSKHKITISRADNKFEIICLLLYNANKR